MSDKKPSTADIMSKIRGAAPASPSADSTPPAEAVQETSTTSAASESQPTAEAPKGTASILASIKGGGAAKPASEVPKGTANILDSIKGGGAAKPATEAPKGTASIMASIKGGGAAKPAAPKAGGSILDSIRGGGAGASAASAKADKPAAKSEAVDTGAAAGMTAAEMIRAAREGLPAGGGSAVANAAPARPALPKKPLVKPAGKSQAPVESRRSAFVSILSWVSQPVVLAWASLTAATAVSSLAMARFMMPNVLVEPPTKFKIGPMTDYGAGTVATKWKAQFGVWIVNDEIDGQQMVYALSTVCTHLGCTPNWLEGEQKFKCPCHGSGFYKTGVNFEGPAPRPLERYGIRIAEDGMLEVDKSVKFQQELGQWENAASFVPV